MNTIKSEGLWIDGDCESLYVYFRDNVEIREGLRFTLPDVGRTLVYVGIDGLPVAMQFVDPIKQDTLSDAQAATISSEQAHQILFALASKMVAFTEARRQRLGNELIRDAVKAARSIHAEPVAA